MENIKFKCLKVGFAFPTVVTENYPVVGYDAVRSGFRIFVMTDVAKSSESSMHLLAMSWHGVGLVWALEARRRWL
jgi:hypothetical protein